MNGMALDINDITNYLPKAAFKEAFLMREKKVILGCVHKDYLYRDDMNPIELNKVVSCEFLLYSTYDRETDEYKNAIVLIEIKGTDKRIKHFEIDMVTNRLFYYKKSAFQDDIYILQTHLGKTYELRVQNSNLLDNPLIGYLFSRYKIKKKRSFVHSSIVSTKKESLTSSLACRYTRKAFSKMLFEQKQVAHGYDIVKILEKKLQFLYDPNFLLIQNKRAKLLDLEIFDFNDKKRAWITDSLYETLSMGFLHSHAQKTLFKQVIKTVTHDSELENPLDSHFSKQKAEAEAAEIKRSFDDALGDTAESFECKTISQEEAFKQRLALRIDRIKRKHEGELTQDRLDEIERGLRVELEQEEKDRKDLMASIAKDHARAKAKKEALEQIEGSKKVADYFSSIGASSDHIAERKPNIADFISNTNLSEYLDFNLIDFQEQDEMIRRMTTVSESSVSGVFKGRHLKSGRASTSFDWGVRAQVTIKDFGQFSQKLDDLAVHCPNFSHVVDHIKKRTALRVKGNAVFGFEPLLLLGKPGVGKSYFAKKLSQILGFRVSQINLESAQTAAQIVGTSHHFGKSNFGAIFENLALGQFTNPIIFVDEIDKAGSSNTTKGFTDSLTPFYQLLEVEQAKSFCDLSIPTVELDASQISWIFTANDLDSIPKPIANRLRIFDVENPTLDQFEVIAQSIVKELLEIYGVTDWHFTLSSDEIESLYRYAFEQDKSLRDVKREIDSYMCDKAINDQAVLVLDEVVVKPSMGFV